MPNIMKIKSRHKIEFGESEGIAVANSVKMQCRPHIANPYVVA